MITVNNPAKRCRLCHVEKNIFEFTHRTNGYVNTYCKPCCSKQSLESRRKFPRTQKSYMLTRYYGITLDEYEKLFDNQHGKCAICGLSENRRKLCVDHSHTTGDVRGLLCTKCNMMLGSARDSKQILSKAIEYLDSNTKW